MQKLMVLGAAVVLFFYQHPVRTQATDHELVGTWHLAGYECPEGDSCSNYVITGELVLSADGTMSWTHFTDLTREEICVSTWRVEKPNVLRWTAEGSSAARVACGVPFGDVFRYRVSGRSLALVDDDEAYRMTLQRGKQASPPPPPVSCSCIAGLSEHPALATPAVELAATAQRLSMEENAPVREAMIREREKTLSAAWRAFKGRSAAVTLHTREFGDDSGPYHQYLAVRRGHAELIKIEDRGGFGLGQTCSCPLADSIRLKCQDARRRLRIVNDTPSAQSCRPASIAYPGGTFPP